MGGKTERSRATGNSHKELKLTPGEELLIWRRRMDWTQTEAAVHFKVSLFAIKLAEYDKKPTFPYKKDTGISLRDHEKCLIYRKRSKKFQTQIAKELGIGREWLRMQELGKVDCVKLLSYWENA